MKAYTQIVVRVLLGTGYIYIDVATLGCITSLYRYRIVCLSLSVAVAPVRLLACIVR